MLVQAVVVVPVQPSGEHATTAALFATAGTTMGRLVSMFFLPAARRLLIGSVVGRSSQVRENAVLIENTGCSVEPTLLYAPPPHPKSVCSLTVHNI